MDKTEWLNSLQVGDIVALVGGRRGPELREITKITKTQIVIGDWRFRKRNGSKFGDSSSWGPWWEIEQVTKNHYDEIEKNKILKLISTIKWDKIPLENLRVVLSTLEGLKNNQEEPWDKEK